MSDWGRISATSQYKNEQKRPKMMYNKTCVDGHSQKDQKLVFKTNYKSLNAGQKYCRMLQWGALCNNFDLN